MSLLIQYVLLIVILLGGASFVIWYHALLKNNVQPQQIDNTDTPEVDTKTDKLLGKQELYKSLKDTYSLSKASDKTTYLRYKKILKQIETAYTKNDLAALRKLHSADSKK